MTYSRISRWLTHAMLAFLIATTIYVSNAAAIGYALHEDNILELQIAKDAPTRIIIEGEKISDIFIHPGEAAEAVVHSSGCLFILPQVGKDKVYLTLIGENGTVQDLVLRFTGKSPSPVRLLKLDWAKEAKININTKINVKEKGKT